MINEEVNIDIDVNDNGTVQQAAQEFDQLTQSIETTSEATNDFSKAQTKTADASKKAKLEVDGVFKGSKALVSGFKAAIGAMSLFGTQSEELNNTLLKVQGVMSLSKGLVGFKKFLPEVKNLANGFKSTLTNAVQGFSKASKIALASTGIGLLVVAIGSIVAYWDEIKAAVSGVSDEQKKLLADQEASAALAQQQIDDISTQENILRQQGKTEEDILNLKIAASKNAIVALEAQLQTQKELKKAQVDAAKRNQEITQGILRFLTLPVTILLGAVDALTYGLKEVGVLDEATNLEETFSKSLASFIFDPEEVAKDADATIKETEDNITKLKNTVAGYEMSVTKIKEDGIQKRKDAEQKEIDEQKKRNEELLKLSQDLAKQRELIDKDEFEKRRILAERQFQDLVKGLNKETQAYKDALYLRNAEIDKINQEQHNKQVEEQVALQEYLAQVDAENLEAFNKQVEEEVALQEYLAQVDEENKQAEIQREQAVQDVKDKLFNEAQGLANALIGLAGQQSKVGKALALAQIGADTAKALSSALANSQSPTPDNVLTGGLAGIAKYIALAGTILTNSKRAYDIIKAPAPTGGAKGGVPSSPGVPQLNAPRLGGQLNADNELTQMRKVYVVESDITSTQAKVSNTQKVSLVE